MDHSIVYALVCEKELSHKVKKPGNPNLVARIKLYILVAFVFRRYQSSTAEECGANGLVSSFIILSIFFPSPQQSYLHQFSVTTEPVIIEVVHARSRILLKIADNDSCLVKPKNLMLVYSFVFPLPCQRLPNILAKNQPKLP